MEKHLSFYEMIVSIFLDLKSAQSRKRMPLFLLGTIIFAWFIQVTYNLVFNLSVLFFYSKADEKTFRDFRGIIIPSIIFLILILITYIYYKRNNKVETSIRGDISPEKHKGLALLLSAIPEDKKDKPVDYRKTDSFKNDLKHEDLKRIRKNIFKTNWGPLMYVIEYHKSKLHHCWLICSTGQKGSDKNFDEASTLIRKIVPNCNVYRVDFHEPYKINETDIKMIRNIFLNSSDYGLTRNDIIFDFTGGTAVMSGSMIMATIDDDLVLEYLRQDINSVGDALEEDGHYKPEFLDEDGHYLLKSDYGFLLSIETKRNIIKN